MKKYIWIITLSIVSIFLSLLFAGCGKITFTRKSDQAQVQPVKQGGPPSWAPAYGRRAKYQYNYYPAAEVYHNSDSGEYFWLEAGRWKVGVELPRTVTLDLGEKVVLEMDSAKPYTHHDNVKKRHPGKKKGHGKGRKK
ncbi:hypothetical protein ACFL54_00475 [Planctomycetota bacterium]